MGRKLNPNSDAWGGAWGSASAWGGTWGWSWGPIAVEEEPSRYRSPVISVSGGNDTSKVHLAELYAKKSSKNTKSKIELMQEDNDLIALLGFMISNKVII
jgi:hypothetical protein